MSKKKQIEKGEWQERLQTFTSGNRKRKAGISVDGTNLIEDKPFVSVDYDPVGKGQDLVITVEDYTHIVDLPSKLYLVHDEQGMVTALEVVAQNGQTCFLKFY